MIEFPTVSKEIRSLISRRQELITFLGSVFATLGIFLQNTLQGNLPPALTTLEEHVFRFYSLMLMVPCLILALRMARLHGGMVLNGILYARLMQNQAFTRQGNTDRAARHNYFGVSFLQFLLADFIAAFSATVLVFTWMHRPEAALVAGGLVFVAWLMVYFLFHARAVRFARAKIAAEDCAAFDRADWEAHVSDSMEDANHGLIGTISFVGLIIFSVFEVMSGLGQIKTTHTTDLRLDQIRLYGPEAYTVLMLVTCVVGLITYLRVRVAIGGFSLDLDPSDRPFQPLKLTDSFLGYLLLAFFTAVSSYLFLIQVAPGLGSEVCLAISFAVFLIAALAEQMTLVSAGRRVVGRPTPPEPEEPEGEHTYASLRTLEPPPPVLPSAARRGTTPAPSQSDVAGLGNATAPPPKGASPGDLQGDRRPPT